MHRRCIDIAGRAAVAHDQPFGGTLWRLAEQVKGVDREVELQRGVCRQTGSA